MKKVLMIAHQFPPIGGSGVQRTVKFIKYLPNFGWKGVVLTRQAKKAQLTDDTLLKDIPQNTNVHRTRAWDLSELFSPLDLAGKLIRRRVLIPDGERLWEIFSHKTAINLVKDENIDLIYSTSQPFSTHLLALKVKQAYPDIPWVADFRDEWTNNAFVKAYNYLPYRVKKEKALERQVFEYSDAIVINTPVMRDNSVKDNPDLAQKFHVIPNGFDVEDFKGIQVGDIKNSKFTLTYTGLIYGNTSPETVFAAVKQLKDQGAIDLSDICLRFIGRFKLEDLEKMARGYDLQDVVEFLPYMPHRDSISNLMNSDAVLLILGKGTDAIYTGKLMEYINTNKPILATIPENGAAAKLISETKTGLVSDCEDVQATARNFKILYDNWRQDKEAFNPDKQKVSQYERQELTKKLADIFNKLC
ncbi:MAG TPA: glycosyltransferase family 4 protein [Thermoclostridium sp.]|nr:glycosyltransferase family 4 protein [Thermoclostridium sp.]